MASSISPMPVATSSMPSTTRHPPRGRRQRNDSHDSPRPGHWHRADLTLLSLCRRSRRSLHHRTPEPISSTPSSPRPPVAEATSPLSLALAQQAMQETAASAISPRSATPSALPSMAAAISSSSIKATAPSARSLTRAQRSPSAHHGRTKLACHGSEPQQLRHRQSQPHRSFPQPPTRISPSMATPPPAAPQSSPAPPAISV